MAEQKTLAERLADTRTKARSKPFERYRELLLTPDADLGDEDIAELARVGESLGRGPTDLDSDRELLGRVRALEAQAGELERRQAHVSECVKKAAELREWADARRKKVEAEITAKVEPAETARVRAQAALDQSTQAGRELTALVDQVEAIRAGASVAEIRERRRQERRAEQQKAYLASGRVRAASGSAVA